MLGFRCHSCLGTLVKKRNVKSSPCVPMFNRYLCSLSGSLTAFTVLWLSNSAPSFCHTVFRPLCHKQQTQLMWTVKWLHFFLSCMIYLLLLNLLIASVKENTVLTAFSSSPKCCLHTLLALHRNISPF